MTKKEARIILKKFKKASYGHILCIIPNEVVEALKTLKVAKSRPLTNKTL